MDVPWFDEAILELLGKKCSRHIFKNNDGCTYDRKKEKKLHIVAQWWKYRSLGGVSILRVEKQFMWVKATPNEALYRSTLEDNSLSSEQQLKPEESWIIHQDRRNSWMFRSAQCGVTSVNSFVKRFPSI